MKDVTALHLHICTEWNEDNANGLPEMRSFWPHLLSRWLEPLADQLETLTLYWDNHWGLFPPMDLRDLHFPRLKSLSLGAYVFGLDEQLEWLLSHKTLEHLSFDSCAICSSWDIPDPPNEHHLHDELRFAQRRLPVSTTFDPQAGLGELGSEWVFKYDGRWPTYFARMAKELPKLRRFQFGHNWDPWGHVSWLLIELFSFCRTDTKGLRRNDQILNKIRDLKIAT